jgi:hypothetical protein
VSDRLATVSQILSDLRATLAESEVRIAALLAQLRPSGVQPQAAPLDASSKAAA